MKRTGYRIVMLCLTICLLLPAWIGSLPVYAATEVSVQNGTGTREAFRVEDTCSYRAIVNEPFTAFAFFLPTWEQTDSGATLSVYAWQGSYDATLAQTPLASQSFSPLQDGGCYFVECDEQPAGEYLFHISNVRSTVGVWLNSSPVQSKGFLYVNGVEQRGEPELWLRLTQPTSEPFGVCQPTGRFYERLSPYTGVAETKNVSALQTPLGMRLHPATDFTGVRFMLATYTLPDLKVNLSVYRWAGTYAETVAGEPLICERILLEDNAMQGIHFDPLPAGEYLFLLDEFSQTPAIYAHSDVEACQGVIYQNGYPSDSNVLYPVMELEFYGEETPYYLPCTEVAGELTEVVEASAPYEIPSDSLINTHPVMPDTWVFTDGLGRVSLTNAEVGDPKPDKTLAMFYWTWHIDNLTAEIPNNLQALSETYPEAMRDWDNELWQNLTNTYFWNEPIYGYYLGTDAWVLRKQAELLTNAGVDVIFTDNTNGTTTWKAAYTALMDTWTDAMNDGVKTPKVSFILPFFNGDDTNQQLQSLFNDVYRTGTHQNLWFYWDGKPMLMAMKSAVSNPMSKTESSITDFFTFRTPQPNYVMPRTALSSWGWLSMYPQALYYHDNAARKAGSVEQMTVGIAMNHNYVTHQLASMNGDHIAGRSYTSTDPERYQREGAEASKWGYNFAEQWNYALEVDPSVVFVTGWNEFRVGRYEMWPSESNGTENAFPDQYNDEFSRDIEPTRGALQDHYYYQLVNFARQYKGARAIPTPSANQTIDLNGGYEQWKTVAPYYGAYIGNTDDRDADGYGDLHYTETSGRNDIIGAQVARDAEFLYFLVECAEDITPYTDPLWMNLYLDTDPDNQGWNTFEYVLNKTPASAETMVLERFTAENDYSQTEVVAEVDYVQDGRYLTVKIPKSAVQLTGDDYTVNFTWTDHVHDEENDAVYSGDILDFYVSGDAAPGGRFKYSFVSTAENAHADATPTGAESNSPTGWILLSVGLVVLIGVATAVFLLRKRKKQDSASAASR